MEINNLSHSMTLTYVKLQEMHGGPTTSLSRTRSFPNVVIVISLQSMSSFTVQRSPCSCICSMITTCHAAGVNVIADTILNHMAGSDSGEGVDGSTFTHYVYDGIYQDQVGSWQKIVNITDLLFVGLPPLHSDLGWPDCRL